MSDKPMSWQKFAATLFAGFFIFVGYIVYDERDFITAQIYTTITKVEYSVNHSATPGILKELMRDTGALASMAWEFDWATNQRRLVVAMTKDGQEILKGLDLLTIMRPNSQNNTMVVNTLFSAQHTCVNITDDSSADIKVVKTNIPEVVVYCITGLKTMYGEVRGAITIFLPKTPVDQIVIGAKLRNAAEKILARR